MSDRHKDPRIARVEWGRLEGQRPRPAGSNARLGEHGQAVRHPIARVTTEEGASGFGPSGYGPSSVAYDQAQALVGRRLSEAFPPNHPVGGVPEAFSALEFPLWDLRGQLEGRPVYALVGSPQAAPAGPLRVRCYDTSLYFDDLHLTGEAEAGALLAEEARAGFECGHRAFKLKVGRGARHMPLIEGTQRDIAVIRAVREAVGPATALMIDANNCYNLNLTKQVLEETADCRLFWVEEAFHEDSILYRDLKAWMEARRIQTLIADGEGDASPHLMAWAREGIVDVLQYDIFSHGLTRWLATGRQLEGMTTGIAPHHYGRHCGNYISGHLAGGVPNFLFVEWDEATTPGLEAPGYHLEEGWITIPDTPGFGLRLDEAVFRQAIDNGGFRLSL